MRTMLSHTRMLHAQERLLLIKFINKSIEWVIYNASINNFLFTYS